MVLLKLAEVRTARTGELAAAASHSAAVLILTDSTGQTFSPSIPMLYSPPIGWEQALTVASLPVITVVVIVPVVVFVEEDPTTHAMAV